MPSQTVALQMFTSYMNPKSRFSKNDLFKTAEAKDFKASWENFVATYQDLVGYLERVDYFQCCGPVDATNPGWGVPIASTKGPITAQAGIMFNVCLMHRLEGMKAAVMSASKIEGEIQKDAQILIDWLVFERLEGKLWSGSGDSTAAKKIQDYKDYTKPIPKVSDKDWMNLLAQLFWGENVQPAKGSKGGKPKTFRTHGPDKTTISQPYCGGRRIGEYTTSGKNSFSNMSTIFLLHYYFTLGTKSPQRKWGSIDAKKFQWDHIIAESTLAKLPKTEQDLWCNNTANCCAFVGSSRVDLQACKLEYS
ncbi:MAG: hypothetical protein DBX05_07120, partial [Candidatus Poseidoniales archaeon]